MQKQKQHLVSQAQVCRNCWRRSFHFHQRSAVPTGDSSTCPRNARWFWFSACAARAPRAEPARTEPASHICLCWVMHEEGGQEVLCCDSYCAPETWAGRVIPFPVCLFTPSFPVTVQGTSMFRKIYLWKKKIKNLFPRFHRQAKNFFISYLHSQRLFFFISYFHSKVWKLFFKSAERRTWKDYVSALHLESVNFSVNKAHLYTPYWISLA